MDAWTSQEVCDFLTGKDYAELGTEMLDVLSVSVIAGFGRVHRWENDTNSD